VDFHIGHDAPPLIVASGILERSCSYLVGKDVLMPRQIDSSILEMALVGYQAEYQKIVEKIAAIQRQLGGRLSAVATTSAPAPKRRLSAAARRRIAAAQKKRWKEFHAKRAAAAK
jgi:hypothetical protein